jgi:hypothetical protein
MRLEHEKPSDNIEDRRGENAGVPFPRPGRVRVPIGGRRGGLSLGTLLLLLLLMLVFGINPLDILSDGNLRVPGEQQTSEPQPPSTQSQAGDDEMKDFVARVLGTTERTWERIFASEGRRYERPRLVLFTGAVQSACGMAQSAMGPFYCPGDSKVYIDLSFYRDMKSKLGASGDFAEAYVIAHEVGHHVQNLLGIAGKVTAARMRLPQAEANALSVRMELQADCLAGVWAHQADAAGRILEEGDIEEGLNAASAIGDDRLQRRSQGHVVPESFTHGTSAQRVAWFKRGWKSGDADSCDTFNASQL